VKKFVIIISCLLFSIAILVIIEVNTLTTTTLHITPSEDNVITEFALQSESNVVFPSDRWYYDFMDETIPEQTEPEPQTEEIIESSLPLITEEGIVWLVPPTLEHDHISFCGQGGFIDSERRIICPVTGTLTDGWCGHGGGPRDSVFVYDLERNLFGEPMYHPGGYGRALLGMHPIDEALSWFGLRGLNVVQAVDSSKRNYRAWAWGEEPLYMWYLTDDAFPQRFHIV